MTVHYVPYITTAAGACLTQANWHELNIQYAVCRLEDILIKPGLDFWQKGKDLKTYLAWDKTLFLDATSFQLHKEWVVKSPYDGTRITLNSNQFWALVEQWKPDGVLISDDLLVMGSESPRTLLSAVGLATSLMITKVTHDKKGIRFDFKDQSFWASDQPAQDAMQGIIYHPAGNYHLQAKEYALDFQVLDEHCHCPTCQQTLTRSYLHYLQQSTPLLCQRFLLMHNVFYRKIIYLNAKSRYDVPTKF